jgi:hypothetical protein
MRTKMQLATKVAPALKIKTTTIYIAGAVVIVTLIGIALFIQLNIGNNTDTYAAAGTFNSNGSGNWINNATWAGGVAPSAALDRDNITIRANHSVLRSGDITGDNDVVLTIQSNATLTINGNLTIQNNLILNNSGTLVITGNLLTKNNSGITVNGGGAMNIGGDAIFENNTNFVVNGNLTVGNNITFGSNSTFNGTGTVKIGGSGCSKWTGSNSCQAGPVILPVELLRFAAVDNGVGMVKINWATAMEKNNDYFTIQRSKDGITYSDLTTLQGKGTTQEVSEYEMLDVNPFAEKLYSRLSQTYFDGTTETFSPVLVNVKLETGSISAYPNPFTGRNLTVNLPQEEAGTLQIVDHRGDVITTREIDGSSKVIELEFDRDLPQGLYYINYKSGSTVKSLKVVKR